MDHSAINLSNFQDNITHNVEYDTLEIAVRSSVVILVSIIIILSNLFNLVILKTTRHMSPATNVFLTNLATADFCSGLIVCLPAIGPTITGSWPYGAAWCQISGIVYGTCCAMSIWSVGLVGVDRYIAVRYPVKYKQKLTPRISLVIVCALWAWSIILFAAPIITKASDAMFFQFNPKVGMCTGVCKTKWLCIVYGILTSAVSGFLVIFTTTSVAKALRKGMPATNGAGITVKTESTIQQRTWSHREKKAIRLLVITTSVYFITWGPYCVVLLLESLGLVSVFPTWLLFALFWIANSNYFVNVIIYSAIYPSFRSRLKKLFYTFFCCRCFRTESRVEALTM